MDDDLLRQMEEAIKDHEKSIEEEFAAIGKDRLDLVVELQKAKIQRKLPSLVDNLLELADSSDSDTVRLNATKHAISLLLGDDPESGKESPMEQMLRKLMKPEGEEESKPTDGP